MKTFKNGKPIFKYLELIKQCIGCGKTIYQTWQTKRKDWNLTKYCSIRCSRLGRGNPWSQKRKKLFSKKRMSINNPNFKDGIYLNKSGYEIISIFNTNKPYHRYLMEQYLNKKLLKNEDVHHKNGIKTDNRLENLQVIEKQSHGYLHRFQQNVERWQKKYLTGEVTWKEASDAISILSIAHVQMTLNKELIAATERSHI